MGTYGFIFHGDLWAAQGTLHDGDYLLLEMGLHDALYFITAHDHCVGDLFVAQRCFSDLLGHTLYGDVLYARRVSDDDAYSFLRIALHDAFHLLLRISVWLICMLRSAPSVIFLCPHRFILMGTCWLLGASGTMLCIRSSGQLCAKLFIYCRRCVVR